MSLEALNLFTSYKAQENQFTNALVSILRLSMLSGSDVTRFLFEPKLPRQFQFRDFYVLKGKEYGNRETVDAIICGKNSCIQIETKITSGSLKTEQIARHLAKLKRRAHKHRRLILLTPDDSRSAYIKQFVSMDNATILHLEWRSVYKKLEMLLANRKPPLFAEIVRQFLEHIRNQVFERDFAGIIQKIDFSERSGVDKTGYIKEMIDGEWKRWNTPRKYEKLDGTGRKLLLYEKGKGITVEVEIKKVKKTKSEAGFDWTNFFAKKPHVFPTPIPLAHIEGLGDKFMSFGRNRSAFQNLTQEQYEKLQRA